MRIVSLRQLIISQMARRLALLAQLCAAFGFSNETLFSSGGGARELQVLSRAEIKWYSRATSFFPVGFNCDDADDNGMVTSFGAPLTIQDPEPSNLPLNLVALSLSHFVVLGSQRGGSQLYVGSVMSTRDAGRTWRCEGHSNHALTAGAAYFAVPTADNNNTSSALSSASALCVAGGRLPLTSSAV